MTHYEGKIIEEMAKLAKGLASRGKEPMVFDWDKAARIIRKKGAKSAYAGLSDDWIHTGGMILTEGKPTPSEGSFAYLASTWATPELEVDGQITECFKMQKDTNQWDSDTFWPESALKILQGDE